MESNSTEPDLYKSYGIIYKIVNKVNGKVYIGQTIRSIKKRWQGHIDNSKILSNKMVICTAIAKYGKAARFLFPEINDLKSSGIFGSIDRSAKMDGKHMVITGNI